MSMPYDVIYCSKCDFQAVSTVLWGRFLYWADDGKEAYFSRKLGWCHDCKTVRAIEELPQVEQVLRRRIELDQELNGDLRMDRFLAWMGTEKSWRLKHALEERDGLDVLETVANLERKPRCLACTSENVADIQAPFARDLPSTFDMELPFFHPDCGGSLRFKDSKGYRLAKGPSVLRMTVEGNFIGPRPQTEESYTVAAYYGPPKEEQ